MPSTLAITGCGTRWMVSISSRAEVEELLEERQVAADHLAQIVAGGERRAGGVEDDRSHAARAHAPERGEQLPHQLEAQRVALVGPVRVTRAAGPSWRTSTVAPVASVLMPLTIPLSAGDADPLDTARLDGEVPV